MQQYMAMIQQPDWVKNHIDAHKAAIEETGQHENPSDRYFQEASQRVIAEASGVEYEEKMLSPAETDKYIKRPEDLLAKYRGDEAAMNKDIEAIENSDSLADVFLDDLS